MIPLTALLAVAVAAGPGPRLPGDAPARRADTAAAALWQVALTGGFEAFTSQRTAWQAYDARIERRDGRGALALEGVLDRRFSLWDAGGGVDAYRVLWPRAYGNVRVVVAPGAAVIPRLDASAEIFQGVGAGWEISAGYRRMSFPGEGVDLWAASAGRYAGSWYVRARGIVVPHRGAVGGSLGLLVRRGLGAPGDLVEISAATGKEVVTIGVGMVEVRTSSELVLRFQKFVTSRVGVSLAATYAAEQGIPARRGLTVGVLRRL